MVESNFDSEHRRGTILIMPNRSASWRTNKIFLWIAAGYAVVIATVFALFGLWLILPFAGLEVLALVLLLHRVSYRCHNRELIQLDGQQLSVRQGCNIPRDIWTSELFWTRVVVEKAKYRGHPDRLCLRNREAMIEVGAFLTETERKQLHAALRNLISLAG
ncbi:MAG: DUF2244 domain-containing protein [Gammaproteobacteria bacterium]|nr:DUF2244 domain-containing protein [Gammaproteobacteria bacterium]